MAVAGANMTKPAIIHLSPDAALTAWPDFPETEISSGARGNRGHRWFQDDELGLGVWVWEAEANLGRWMNWPVHEFMVVVEGEVVVVEEDRETVVGPGECFFIPKGRRCIWNQPRYFKKFMLMFDIPSEQSKGSARSIIKIDPQVKLGSSVVPTATSQSGPSVGHSHYYFKDANNQFSVGIWDATNWQNKLIEFPHHEMMHVLEGVVTFTDDKGSKRAFQPGDTFFIPMGAPTSWNVDGDLRMAFCRFQPN